MANIDSILGDDLAAISKLYEIDPEFENVRDISIVMSED